MRWATYTWYHESHFIIFFFFFTVTYHGRRDADYTVIIGSRATGTASCLVLLLCYLAGFLTATGQGGQFPFSSWRHSPHTSLFFFFLSFFFFLINSTMGCHRIDGQHASFFFVFFFFSFCFVLLRQVLYTT